MKIELVGSYAQAREFLLMPLSLYKNDPSYVRPLDEDVESVFDPTKNALFENGTCARWILRDKNSIVVGRIAAFVNAKTAYTFEQPTGGTGFFECINNNEAAGLLFDTAKTWLQEQGMEAMDGPINFGDRDRWWGLLVEGFHRPNYCCNYNPAYYQQLFENYGFGVYFRQFTYWKDVKKPQPKSYYLVAERVFRDKNYEIKKLDKKKLWKFAEDFRSVYNRAWAAHEGVDPMTPDHADRLLSKLKPVIDERIAFFAYHNQQPIGFFLCLPELNELFVKDVNGKLNLPGRLRFLWNKFTDKCTTVYGLAFGVVPEYQRKGVEAAMVVYADRHITIDKWPYKTIQMNWIGDFNPKMMQVAELIDGVIYKTHHTYRYLFDRQKPFRRMPIL